MRANQLVRAGRTGLSLFPSPFDSFLGSFRSFERPAGSATAFRVDFTESDADYRFEAELPGVEEGDINVSLEDGVLTIQAEKRSESSEEENGRRYVERSYGTFRRRFTLPLEVDSESIEAKLAKGVLSVRLPKAPAAQPRKIDILTGD